MVEVVQFLPNWSCFRSVLRTFIHLRPGVHEDLFENNDVRHV